MKKRRRLGEFGEGGFGGFHAHLAERDLRFAPVIEFLNDAHLAGEGSGEKLYTVAGLERAGLCRNQRSGGLRGLGWFWRGARGLRRLALLRSGATALVSPFLAWVVAPGLVRTRSAPIIPAIIAWTLIKTGSFLASRARRSAPLFGTAGFFGPRVARLGGALGRRSRYRDRRGARRRSRTRRAGLRRFTGRRFGASGFLLGAPLDGVLAGGFAGCLVASGFLASGLGASGFLL